jgi:hypothetical protein
MHRVGYLSRITARCTENKILKNLVLWLQMLTRAHTLKTTALKYGRQLREQF